MENRIVDEIRVLLVWIGEREQKHYFEQKVKDCRHVECVRMRDVFTPKQIDFINSFYKTQQKQCYRNAAELVFLIEKADWLFDTPVRYVEGYGYCMFPIEHAFVKVGELYIDPTFERACHLNVRKEQYASLIELTPEALRKYLLETGCYGGLYEYDYYLKHNPERAEAIRKMNPVK